MSLLSIDILGVLSGTYSKTGGSSCLSLLILSNLIPKRSAFYTSLMFEGYLDGYFFGVMY
jgi:hypothetical protein